MADVKLKPFLQIINGIRVPGKWKSECVKEAMEYKPNPEDVFIVTYPKCGTTWMQVVAFHIFRKGKEMEDYGEFSRLCPFIDSQGLKGIVNMPRPGAFKTHLPYNLMPYSPDAKYIFVLRNPKDECVSLFHYAKAGEYGYSEAIFDDFFELFMAGEFAYNDYFDHVQSWYPHRNDKEIFHTTYEDMKEDLKSVVLKLASFLGKEYRDSIEEDNNVLRNILHFSEFEYMKKRLARNFDSVHQNGCETSLETDATRSWMAKVRNIHFRKGIIGDWRTHFSEEQSERLNQKFYDRFGGTDLYEKYKPYL